MAAAHDVRESLRTLRRQPGFALAVVITFALAIGTNTAIFAALYAVVLKPLPFRDPSQLVVIWRQNPVRAHPVMEVSHHSFRAWTARTHSFERLAEISSTNLSFAWRLQNGDRRRVEAAGVSHEFFSVLGVSPSLGRAFLPEEDRQHAPRAVILSDGFWAREFHRDPAIVGRTLTLDDQPVTIVGVMPHGFAYPYGAEVWTPVVPMIRADMLDKPWWGVLYVVGRLASGVTPSQAKQELDPLVRQLDREEDLPGFETLSSVVTPLTDHIYGHTRPIVMALGGTGVMVLVIACANVIGLLLIRALARRRDSAIRVALGASRWRMIRLWLVESLLLASAGAIGGVLLAWWGSRALVALAPASTPHLDLITVNVPVLVFAVVISLAAALACGIAPAWVASRSALYDSLKDGARESEARSRRRTRHALVIAQLGLAMMLLVAAGLMVRSVVNLRRLDLGYRPEGVLTIDIAPKVTNTAQHRAFYDELLARVRALRGVTAAGATYQLPLIYGPIGMDSGVLLEGQSIEARNGVNNPTLNLLSVTPGYFEAMGTRLVAGRTFTSRDTLASPTVVVVGETMARLLWPGQHAIGKRLYIPGFPKDAQGRFQLQTVIGIVADGRFRGIDDVRADVYVPNQQNDLRVNALVVGTHSDDPLGLAPEIRTLVRTLNGDAVISGVRTLDTIVGTATAPWRFGMLLFAVLSIVAFALAVTGLFALVSYSVAQRHREIAVRLALRALPAQVRTMIVRQGATLILLGLACGLAGALIVARALASLLFGVAPLDVSTFAVVVALVALVALTACHLAARRTTRIDALTLLR